MATRKTWEAPPLPCGGNARLVRRGRVRDRTRRDAVWRGDTAQEAFISTMFRMLYTGWCHTPGGNGALISACDRIRHSLRSIASSLRRGAPWRFCHGEGRSTGGLLRPLLFRDTLHVSLPLHMRRHCVRISHRHFAHLTVHLGGDREEGAGTGRVLFIFPRRFSPPPFFDSSPDAPDVA